MKKFSLVFLSIIVFVSTFFSSVSSAATIGQKLPAPEAGWKRYDDSSPQIRYEGVWLVESNAAYLNGKSRYSEFNNTNSKLTFKFKGTKLRILGPTYINKPNDIPITIDGITETFSGYASTLTFGQVLLYEKTGLPDAVHTVTIETPQSVANITKGDIQFDAFDIDESGYLINDDISIPVLSATGGILKVDLIWPAVSGATGYNLKRSITPGGPYELIGTTSNSSYTDTNVANGTTYYYIVTALNTTGESAPSNEASATPFIPTNPDRALLTIYISGGQIKEYDLSAAELSAFLNWYDAKDAGSGPAKYAFMKTWNKGPFKTRTEYVIFDKILTFDVDEYEVENP